MIMSFKNDAGEEHFASSNFPALKRKAETDDGEHRGKTLFDLCDF